MSTGAGLPAVPEGRRPGGAPDVHSRPVVMARVAVALAAVILATFTVTAILLPHHSGGANVTPSDPVAVFITGVVLSIIALAPTRPRLHADTEAIHVRSFFTSWHDIPWDVVVRVEFPSSIRFARLVLPGEETVPLYAVARMDGQRAVTAMRGLRALHAATHPAAS